MSQFAPLQRSPRGQRSTRADSSQLERTGQIPLAWSYRPGPYHWCRGACRNLDGFTSLRTQITMRVPPPSEACNLRLHHSPQHFVTTTSNHFAPQSVGHRNYRWGWQRSYPPRCWPGWVDEVSVPLSPFAYVEIHTARGYLDSMENFISSESPAKYHPPLGVLIGCEFQIREALAGAIGKENL